MQTPVPTRKRPAKARLLTADSKLPYPEYREEYRLVSYWLVMWMRTTAQYEFIRKKFDKVVYGRCKASVLEADSCWQAIHRTRDATDEYAKNLRDVGGLLFAWAGTTHPAVQS